ncbi:hypothetical protein [Paraburkholderia caballeronis]|uniref:Uncharacterized protein n=1 Tax=Paraburkholderia caballeronis TaxID=416943 RepID=A0A1H7QGG9_9BURK|nr:hypothetical protein [Paraburkholderia caballeronis]PXW22579.1 hypothetical protein C7403_114155 [Paraburkholderia caballeronis]PXW96450.1 hypothetical protein C7407_114155 [Paraburkholderia caballeronis]RAJ92861.1 hypothetical protein C7409_114155 [Paraburkholderia caballeronis]SEE07432.1 hypothetical protein SAMN05445871_4606 [Paraburkholderia caballeronis]SEL46838.1 hypothetical protein SAMN05192542_10889 [Paraburkholderia caballeronis]
MRIIMTGAMLCALASSAFAAEHYVEVWNPPEARIDSARPSAPGKRSHAKKGAKRRIAAADHLAPRKVAGPAERASAALPAAPAKPAMTPQTDRHPALTPKVGPDGRVLQVGYRLPASRASAGIRLP